MNNLSYVHAGGVYLLQSRENSVQFYLVVIRRTGTVL